VNTKAGMTAFGPPKLTSLDTDDNDHVWRW